MLRLSRRFFASRITKQVSGETAGATSPWFVPLAVRQSVDRVAVPVDLASQTAETFTIINQSIQRERDSLIYYYP